MILVPLGPAQRKEEGGRVRRRRRRKGQKQNNTTKKHTSEDSINTIHQQHQLERERQMVRYLQTQREREEMDGKRRKPARGVEVGERAGERGRSGRQQLHKKTKKKQRRERVLLLCSHSPSPALSAGHPLAQGGFYGPIRAAAQLLCVIGRLQESKGDS